MSASNLVLHFISALLLFFFFLRVHVTTDHLLIWRCGRGRSGPRNRHRRRSRRRSNRFRFRRTGVESALLQRAREHVRWRVIRQLLAGRQISFQITDRYQTRWDWVGQTRDRWDRIARRGNRWRWTRRNGRSRRSGLRVGYTAGREQHDQSKEWRQTCAGIQFRFYRHIHKTSCDERVAHFQREMQPTCQVHLLGRRSGGLSGLRETAGS